MVAITGNVPGALIGKDAFQEIDINGITLPMTKHNYLVRDADDIPRVVAEAFHIAGPAAPGPVHIDITKDALQQETTAEHPTHDEVIAGLPGFRPNTRRPPEAAEAGRRRDRRGQAPGDPRRPRRPPSPRRWDELRAFAEKTQIPVAWTLLGIGAIDETHPLAYGYMGMHGWKHVNRAIQSADLLIAIGMRFDDRVTGNVRTYAPYARIIHADIDPAEIGKNVAVEVPDRRRREARPRGPHRGSSSRSTRRPAPTTSPSSPSGGATPRARRGTAPARGATASSPPTTWSSGSAS